MERNKVLFLANVGSHIDTIEYITRTFHEISDNLIFDCLILDIVDWHTWNSSQRHYSGEGIRRQLSHYEWGFRSPIILNKERESLIRAASVFLIKEAVNLLVTLTDTEYPNWALIQAAKQNGIPSLLIQEGPRPRKHLGNEPNSVNFKRLIYKVAATLIKKYLSFCNSLRDGTFIVKLAGKISGEYRRFQLPPYGDGGAMIMAVASDYYARYYSETLENKPVIKVTGIPRFDGLIKSRDKYLKRQKAAKDKTPSHRILVVSQPALRYGELTKEMQNHNYRSIFMGLNNVAQDLPIQVDLRLHPSDHIEDVIPFFEHVPLKVILHSAEEPVSDVLPDYDLVIGCTSTVLLEALIVGVPVISWQKFIPSPGSFITGLKVPIVKEIDQLTQSLKNILARDIDPISETSLINEVGVLDGHASFRVARICVDLIKNNPLFNVSKI
jgi:hypothetical protein